MVWTVYKMNTSKAFFNFVNDKVCEDLCLQETQIVLKTKKIFEKFDNVQGEVCF